jgi:hypothetical protein
MLVIADEQPPEPFGSIAGEAVSAYAVALLLTRTGTGHGISLSASDPGDKHDHTHPGEPHALSLLRFLINREQELVLETDRLAWTWRSHDRQN